MTTHFAAAAHPASGPRGSTGSFVPFSPVDEAVQLLDDDQAPWSIQLEVRVAGRLDAARLRYALASALDAHPMARARRIAARRWASHDRWAVGRARAELEVVDCFDDDQLAAARAELQSRPWRLTAAPPVRAWLARHPGGDVLMLNVHHAAMDGFGALRVLRSLARAYAGDADPAPVVDFGEARQLPARLARAGLATHLRRTSALAERLRDLMAPPARIARDGATNRPGYGFQHRVLSERETEALLAIEGAGTVNDVLVAALHLTIGAWNAGHGAACRRVAVLVPANLRPAHWREDVAGNYALPARITTGRRARRSRTAVVASVTAQTTRKKRTGIGTGFLELLAPASRLPRWAKEAAVKVLPLTGDRLVDTSMFSNLGLLDEPIDFGAAAGATTGMWFSPPGRMPLGVTVGAVTTGGRLHLSFRHLNQQMGEAAARRFADRYMSELGRLSARLSRGRGRGNPGSYGLGALRPVYPAYRSIARRSAA